MTDYEYAILSNQESDFDMCSACEYKGIDTCNNQCMEVEEVYNPNLLRLIHNSSSFRRKELNISI